MAYGKSNRIIFGKRNSGQSCNSGIIELEWKSNQDSKNRSTRLRPGRYRKGQVFTFCFAREEDGDASVYIGEAENVLERLNQHLRDYQTGKENITGIQR